MRRRGGRAEKRSRAKKKRKNRGCIFSRVFPASILGSESPSSLLAAWNLIPAQPLRELKEAARDEGGGKGREEDFKEKKKKETCVGSSFFLCCLSPIETLSLLTFIPG